MENNTPEVNETDSFYEDAVHYWEKIPATIDGMLGGFGFISQTDIDGSKNFLQQLFRTKDPPGKICALDCGAGIGRITKKLLIHIFNKVDMVEQNSAFLEKAIKFLGNSTNKIGTLYSIGLQDFNPENNKYDIIWCQWVLGHLKDEHFVDFLVRCKKSLKGNGMIIIKENLTTSGLVEIDETDSSVTRPLKLYRRLFKKATLTLIKETEQTNFPKGLYGVRMFALKPNEMTVYTTASKINQCSEKTT